MKLLIKKMFAQNFKRLRQKRGQIFSSFAYLRENILKLEEKYLETRQKINLMILYCN